MDVFWTIFGRILVKGVSLGVSLGVSFEWGLMAIVGGCNGGIALVRCFFKRFRWG